MIPNTSDSWYRKYVLGMLNDLSPKRAGFVLSEVRVGTLAQDAPDEAESTLFVSLFRSMVMVDRGRRRSEELSHSVRTYHHTLGKFAMVLL